MSTLDRSLAPRRAFLLLAVLLSTHSPLAVAAEPPATAPPAISAAAHWEWAGWGGGGFFWSCAWHPADRRALYLGGDVAGAYRSVDQGASWQFINHGLNNYAIHSLAVAPSQPDVVYAMTLDGVCRSADGGRNWAVLAATRNDQLGISAQRPGSVRALAVDPTDANLVYAGSGKGGLFRSRDGGATWQKLDYLAHLRPESAPALPAAAAGSGFAVLSFASAGPDAARCGRVEKFLDAKGVDWSTYARLGARLRLSPGAPPLEAQLVVQSGDAWLWQAGPCVPLATDAWTDVSLDLAGLENLQTVRIAYVLVRSPLAAYTGDVYLDQVVLAPVAGAPLVVSDWEKPGDADGWRANRKYEDALYVTALRHSAIPTVVEAGVISAVAVSALEPRQVFAASTELGLFRSHDAGATWQRLETPRHVASVAVSPCAPGLIYAACGEEGAWRSEDGGNTWAAARTGLVEKCAVRELVPDPRDPGAVFCIGNVEWKGYFYRSTDQGRHWQGSRMLRRDLQANPTLPDETGSGQFPAEMADLSRLSNLAVCPLDPKLLFLAGNWRNALSRDGGLTWTESGRGADISCIQDIRFHDGKVYVTAMDEGLLVSPDRGGTWQQLTPRLYQEGVSGHQWRVRVWSQDGRTAILTTASPWAGKQEYPNAVLLSDDGGATFRTVTTGLPATVPRLNTIWGQGYAKALAQDPTDAKVFYLGIDGDPEPDQGRSGGGIFRSRDGGATWEPLPTQPASRRGFFGLAVDPTDPRRLFWGTCGDGIHRTENGGTSWQHVFANESWVFNLHVTATGTVYGGSRDLWRSDDHGATWRKLTAFQDGDPVIVGLEVDPQDGDRLWLSRVTWGDGARGGVFRSQDGGKTWQEITADLPCRKPLVLRYDPASRDLWAGGVGLFRIRQ